jgi:osmotically-inducible protein OsmY
VAARVEGVSRVLDALVVLPGHRSMGQALDDTTIQTKLKTGLVGADGLGDAVAITTEVRQGHVLLAGFVEEKTAKSQAGEVAKGISGVQKVHNLIAVEP